MQAIQLPPDADSVILEGQDGNVSIVLDDGVVVNQGGASSQFSFVPSEALSTWLIPHNLGRNPAVTILDTEGRQVFADVQHLSINVVSIFFSVPMTGRAELS